MSKCGWVTNEMSIFDTINKYLLLDMSMKDAIAKAEADLHTQLPQPIKDRIAEVCR